MAALVLVTMLLALSSLLTESAAFNFQNGNNGQVMWSLDCDFYGGDIGSQAVPGDQCGSLCIANSNCDHFTWANGVCYMKRVSNNPSPTYLGGAVCGYVVNRGSTGTAAPVATSAPASQPQSSGGAIQLSVKNNCAYPTWLATTPNANQQPLPGGIIKLNSGQSYTYNIASSGWAGRFWPKTGCDANGLNCVFGDSAAPCPATGCQPPADTKVEFLWPDQGSNDQAWYDISLVDGYTLPIKIVPRGINSGSCVSTTCAVSLDACPSNENYGLGDLRVIRNGKVVACLAPCKRWNFPAPWGMGKSELLAPGVNMCCPTPPISSQQCSSGPVISTRYVQLVRSSCPSAYSYAYDDEGGLHSCPKSTSFDVTFCP